MKICIYIFTLHNKSIDYGNSLVRTVVKSKNNVPFEFYVCQRNLDQSPHFLKFIPSAFIVA